MRTTRILKKAFDRVDHFIRLHKLESLEIHGGLLRLRHIYTIVPKQLYLVDIDLALYLCHQVCHMTRMLDLSFTMRTFMTFTHVLIALNILYTPMT